MSGSETKSPRRFIDARGGAVDARIGELFRKLVRPESLGPSELDRVHARLSASRSSAAKRMSYVALLATGMLAGTGFAVASYGVQRFVDARRAPSAVPAPASSPPVRTPAARVRPIEKGPIGAGEAPASEPSKRAVAVHPEASSGALGRESELLARALAKLHRDHDPGAALTLLDEHARSFPSGSLRLEADVARVDALLALHRDGDALALLERLPIDHLGRGTELRVIRGELLAQRDPNKAIAEFDRALATGLPRDLDERALFGRAASRLKLGDETGGRADLEAYLTKYPSGRFAAQARRF